ncbi:MAG: NAD(P)H-dependent oxidoreductase subunit E [Candidatus Eremiobacteraeota bacterium]|nr:NAD(P)H-dependent oxidoreductase subunit E [Candidatus Eremiobacteraeota bacterium]
MTFPELRERLQPRCDELIAQYPSKRSALMPIMHLFVDEQGYASKDAMRFCAELLDLTIADVEGVVSFYTLFFQRPIGKYMLQVCRNLSCTLNGAQEIMAHTRARLGVGHLETTEDGLFSYEEVECLAACDRAPCMQINLDFVYDLTPQKIDDMVAAMRAGTYPTAPLPQTERPSRTWIVRDDQEIARGERSAGGIGVADPDDAGGIGDPTGVIMLDRIVSDQARFAGRTRERTIVEPAQILEAIGE